MRLLRYLSVLLALSLGQSAFAAVYDFSSPFSVPSTGYSTTVDGITIDVTTPEGNKLAYYTVSSLGYGLGHSGCVFIVCDNGIQQNESLIFSFSEEVVVSSITLAAWDGPDTAALLATPSGNSLVLDSDPAGQINTFDISALGPLTSFTITNTKFFGLFTVNGLEVVPTSPVPVPASAWLFATGILGLFGIGRNRAKR